MNPSAEPKPTGADGKTPVKPASRESRGLSIQMAAFAVGVSSVGLGLLPEPHGGLVGDSATGNAESSRWRGTVQDKRGRPVANAEIKLGRQTAVSDRNGSFILPAEAQEPKRPAQRLRMQPQDFVVTAEGYAPLAVQLGSNEAAVERAKPLKIVLERVATLAGTVTDEQGPRHGVSVTAIGSGRAGGDAVMSDDAGRFAIHGLPSGTYRVQARAALRTDPRALPNSLLVAQSRLLDVKAGQRAEVTLRLRRGHSVRGQVRTRATERALAAVRVQARADGLSLFGYEAVTDTAGAFQIAGLPAGDYRLSTRAEGYATQARWVHVPAPEGVAFELDSSFKLVGSVHDANGRPAANATVYLTQLDKESGIATNLGVTGAGVPGLGVHQRGAVPPITATPELVGASLHDARVRADTRGRFTFQARGLVGLRAFHPEHASSAVVEVDATKDTAGIVLELGVASKSAP